MWGAAGLELELPHTDQRLPPGALIALGEGALYGRYRVCDGCGHYRGDLLAASPACGEVPFYGLTARATVSQSPG